MNRRPLVLFALLVLASPARARSVPPAAPPLRSFFAVPAKRKEMKPNLSLYVYRRCCTPGEKVQMRLSGFNVHDIQLAAYRLDLRAVVGTSKTLEKLDKVLAARPLQGQTPAAAWRF